MYEDTALSCDIHLSLKFTEIERECATLERRVYLKFNSVLDVVELELDNWTITTDE